MNTVRLLLVDSHELVRTGLTEVLKSARDIAVVGDARDGQEAVHKARTLTPDVILMDIALPTMDGFAAAHKILKHTPDARILFLTPSGDHAHIFQAMKIGARGYLTNDVSVSTLLSSIRRVLSSGAFICPTTTPDDIKSMAEKIRRGDEEYDTLTERELDVLRYLCAGYTSKKIGSLMNISPKTAEHYKFKIKVKLRLRSRAELIRYAIRKGIGVLTP